MLIFRIEHDRKTCSDPFYSEDGKSLTGHGPAKYCTYAANSEKPNFGYCGLLPTRVESSERCAVTLGQFNSWISVRYNYACKYETKACTGHALCAWCDADEIYELQLPDGWHIVAYNVDDAMQDRFWRVDNNQIIFDPAYAEYVGQVPYQYVQELIEQFVGCAA